MTYNIKWWWNILHFSKVKLCILYLCQNRTLFFYPDCCMIQQTSRCLLKQQLKLFSGNYKCVSGFFLIKVVLLFYPALFYELGKSPFCVFHIAKLIILNNERGLQLPAMKKNKNLLPVMRDFFFFIVWLFFYVIYECTLISRNKQTFRWIKRGKETQ